MFRVLLQPVHVQKEKVRAVSPTGSLREADLTQVPPRLLCLLDRSCTSTGTDTPSLADAAAVLVPSGTRPQLVFDSRSCAAAEQPPPAASHLPLACRASPPPQSRKLHVTDAPVRGCCARKPHLEAHARRSGRQPSVIWPCPSTRISRGAPSRVRVFLCLCATAAVGRSVL